MPLLKDTAVDVERLLTVRSALPLLPECAVVAVKVAVIVCVLAEFGVIVTVQVDLSVLDAASVQVPLTVSPTTLEVTETVVPTPGFDFVPLGSVSVIVTVAVVV